MITLVSGETLYNKSCDIWTLPPDRPVLIRDFRKVLFFIFREGPYQTLAKVLARISKDKYYDAKVIAARYQDQNAISYDGGVSFFISDMPSRSWASPFSYDVIGKPDSRLVVTPSTSKKMSLFFSGYGNYAQTYTATLNKYFNLRMFVDHNPNIVAAFKKRFDLTSFYFSDMGDAWSKDTAPAAVIASYHSDHALQAHTLFKGNPDGFIFIEKPPMVDYADIQLFREMYASAANIQIGFNRRYSPLVRKLKQCLTAPDPLIINISVNEVKISDNHWYLWPNQGTRITGNACHWIDLCHYFVNQKPTKLQLAKSAVSPDDCVLNITYQDGSLAVISLTDKGNDLRGVQETIEVKQANSTYRLDDMLHLICDKPGKGREIYRRLIRDKGHKRMYQTFAKDALNGKITSQYPLADLEVVSRITYEFSQMMVTGISEKYITWGSNK